MAQHFIKSDLVLVNFLEMLIKFSIAMLHYNSNELVSKKSLTLAIYYIEVPYLEVRLYFE